MKIATQQLTAAPLVRLLVANALLRAAAGASAASGSSYLAFSGGIYFAAEMVVAPIAGRLADRFGLAVVLRSGAWVAVLAALLSLQISARPDPGALDPKNLVLSQ